MCSSFTEDLALLCGVEMYTVPKREATITPKKFIGSIVPRFTRSKTLGQFSSSVPTNLDQH